MQGSILSTAILNTGSERADRTALFFLRGAHLILQLQRMTNEERPKMNTEPKAIGPKGTEVKRREPSYSTRAVALHELTAFLFAHPSWSAEAAMDAVSTARLNALYAAYKAVQNKPT
jgi:hypothetical protein